jgi:hypothetical protein
MTYVHFNSCSGIAPRLDRAAVTAQVGRAAELGETEEGVHADHLSAVFLEDEQTTVSFDYPPLDVPCQPA